MAGFGNLNPGVEALHNLAQMGYRAWVEEKKVRLRYEGPGNPDPNQVRPLLETVREHKDEVLFFLRCYCPRCGGVVYGTFNGREICMACHYNDLRRLMPGLDLKH